MLRERQPVLDHLVAVDLEDLDVEQDLGFGLVVQLDDAVGHGYLIQRGPHRDRFQLGVGLHALDPGNGAKHIRDGVYFGVDDEERPENEVVILTMLLRVVGNDDDRR